jgi:hypothetical protein
MFSQEATLWKKPDYRPGGCKMSVCATGKEQRNLMPGGCIREELLRAVDDRDDDRRKKCGIRA